jgi:hypothetical protein
MSKKRKPSARKTNKPAPRAKAPKPARPPGAARNAGPGAGGNARPAPSFEEAKRAAIDALVETIEASERRLTAAKRAASFEELNRASG